MDQERYGYGPIASLIFSILGVNIFTIGRIIEWLYLSDFGILVSKFGMFVVIFLGLMPIAILVASNEMTIYLDKKNY